MFKFARGITLTLIATVCFFLAGCQREKQPIPPKLPKPNYMGRILFSLDPKFNASEIHFIQTIHIYRNMKPDANVSYVQELEFTELVERDGKTIFKVTAKRKETAKTNAKGEWPDEHHQKADELITYDGNCYYYKVTVELFRTPDLKKTGIGTLKKGKKSIVHMISSILECGTMPEMSG